MRGGYRGPMRGGRMGAFSGGQPFFARPPPFDLHIASDVFERINNYDEAPLTQAVLAASNKLKMGSTEQEPVKTFLNKIKALILKFGNDPEAVPGLIVEDIEIVGSYGKDTVLVGHREGDLSVILGNLPTFEFVATLGKKVVEELRNQDETVSFVPKDFGGAISNSFCRCRLMITTTPANSIHLEPDLHLPGNLMMYNFHAINHTKFFQSISECSPIKILVPVIKDLRKKYAGLQPLSVWACEFLCHFCFLNTNKGVPLPLGPAFRRFFEVVASGIFLPGSPGLIDGSEPSCRIAFEMTFEEMDLVCATAQSIVRILGNGGFNELLAGTVDITSTPISINGVTVYPQENAFHEECLKPKFCEEDEALAEKLATSVQA